MAKTAKNRRNGNKKKGAAKRPSSTRSTRPNGAGADAITRVRDHVGMLVDPCNAKIGPTAYRGSDGFVTRFRNLTNVTLPTGYAAVHVYYPAYNGVWQQNVADFNAALTPSYSTPGPGQSFLLSNADSQRVVGACTIPTYTGTELNRQGMIYRGTIPEAALVGCSINTLVPLLQFSSRVPDTPLETKYVPSSADERYWKTGSTAPEGAGDLQAIVTIIVGAADTVSFQFNTVLIAEWRPRFGIGMQVPTPNTPDVPAGLEQVRTTLSRLGNWWGDHGPTVMKVAGVVGRAALRTIGAPIMM